MFYLKEQSTVRPVRLELSVCNTFFSRLAGALGPGRIPFRKAYLFPGGGSVHTFFMRSSISVLTFDESGRILSYRRKLAPFRVFPTDSRSLGLLEMAPGRLDVRGDDAVDRYVRFPEELASRLGWGQLSYRGVEDQ